jgi:hypothetical protein
VSTYGGGCGALLDLFPEVEQDAEFRKWGCCISCHDDANAGTMIGEVEVGGKHYEVCCTVLNIYERLHPPTNPTEPGKESA